MERSDNGSEDVEEALDSNYELEHFRAQHSRVVVTGGGKREPYRRIGIIGGGTAGYLTALALRARQPDLEVTLIESSAIPIIGVGEATVPSIIPFLHRYCELDVHRFYAEVRPTWKQGIKFEWGLPGDYHFNAPFDWDLNNIGILGSIEHQANINAMTLQSMLMEHAVVPITGGDGDHLSYLPDIPFAYHLENARLVSYLQKEAVERGVRHLDRTIADVVVTESGDEVDHVVTSEGEKLAFDLYIDCTGFRSMLLGDKLRTPFLSFESSLYTDRALTFSTQHGGRIKPYTTATTMPNGWTWTIPHEDKDNHGYVFSSAFCSPEQAEREARAQWPMLDAITGVVKFRSGRRTEAWRGNVLAIGNAYGFVEPLESTGLYMITNTIERLISMFPLSKQDRAPRMLLNSVTGKQWDTLRSFLVVHYKFNRRLDSQFWQTVRAEAELGAAEMLVHAHQELAPLSFWSPGAFPALYGEAPPFYGLSGWDCIMLGQQVPARRLKLDEPIAAWRRRLQIAEDLCSKCVGQAEALRLVRADRSLLDAVLHEPDGWIGKSIAAVS